MYIGYRERDDANLYMCIKMKQCTLDIEREMMQMYMCPCVCVLVCCPYMMCP